MYSLVRRLTTRELVLEQAPALLSALVVAEMFYKFHSFLLESIAFLATWFLFDAVVQFFARKGRFEE